MKLVKLNLEKVKSRKFAAVSSAAFLAVANSALGLGIDWRVTIAVILGSCLYAGFEAWVDVARIKYAAIEKKTG